MVYFITLGAIALTVGGYFHPAVHAALPAVAELAQIKPSVNDPILRSSDRTLYKELEQLQAEGNWAEADHVLAQIDDEILRGHALAQRYLHKNYDSRPAELKLWMEKYADHPQAGTIYRLAAQKGARNLKKPVYGKILKGNGASQVNQRFSHIGWQSALNAYRAGSYNTAYQRFSALVQNKQTRHWKPWDKAAAHFWAYRAALQSDSPKAATKHLHAAARNPRSFYGIQARYALKQDLGLNLEPATPDDEALETFLNDSTIRRIKALAEVGQTKMAEEEISRYFLRLDAERQRDLLTLALPLNLPAAQIRMGLALEHKGFENLDYALYPTPNWEPSHGYAVDPALIYAVARQESAFNPLARSHAGARGIMQLMPATARYILREMQTPIGKTADLNDPVSSVALGQQYLHYLMGKPYIENNLVYVAVAYNAGPGNLLKWKERYSNDPLLFIETIPSLQTRNYVQNILANYWIYSEMLGNSDRRQVRLAAGQWPLYASTAQQLADNSAFIQNRNSTGSTL